MVENGSYSKIDSIIDCITSCSLLVETEGTEITGLVIYRPQGRHHLIYFLGADDRETRIRLIERAMLKGVSPKYAYRRGKPKIYKDPNKLMKRLLVYG